MMLRDDTRRPPTGAGDRVEERRETQRKARVVYQNGNCVLECVVKDLSESGARIGLGALVGLPETFVLLFDDGGKRPVEVIWSRGRDMGVRFTDVIGATVRAGSKTDLIDRIVSMEKELARLRREVMVHLKE